MKANPFFLFVLSLHLKDKDLFFNWNEHTRYNHQLEYLETTDVIYTIDLMIQRDLQILMPVIPQVSNPNKDKDWDCHTSCKWGDVVLQYYII